MTFRLALLMLCTSTCMAGPDSVVTFNEVHYHPAADADSEWIELHNQMAIRVDVGEWQLRGGISFTFPEGTVLEPGAFMVVSNQAGSPAGALGQFSGKLGNGGDEITLHTRHGRMMDTIQYGDGDGGEWPAAPDGKGFTLAKRIPELASGRASAWMASAQLGGTPGEVNFIGARTDPQQRPLIAVGRSWDVLATNAVPVDWNTAAFDDAAWESAKSPFAAVSPRVATVLLRKRFAFLGEPDGIVLHFDGQASQRATVYVNGQKAGALQPNSAPTAVLLDGSALIVGANVLAVEIAAPSANDAVVFDGNLSAIIDLDLAVAAPHAAGAIVINEIHYHSRPIYADPEAGIPFAKNSDEWIELLNISDQTVDLSGWEFSDGIRYTFPEGTSLRAGAFLVVTDEMFRGSLSNQSDRILLLDAKAVRIDEVTYYDSGRWPSLPDGGGSSLELKDPRSDNSVGDSWAASDETARAGWHEYLYRTTGAEPPGTNNPSNWNEFLIGFLDAGAALIDDVSVVEDPSGANRQLISNRTFNADTPGEQPADWRLLGTHKLSNVVPDPDGNGNVLHLIATGEMTHTYNNGSITLAGNRSIRSGTEYEIRFRAKWLEGSPQLNTRLYLNRAARTHILPQPSSSGTPGAANSRFVPNSGPTFHSVRHSPAVPDADQPIFVTGFVDDPDGVATVDLRFRTDGDNNWSEVPVVRGIDGRVVGIIPGQADNAVVQFFLTASDSFQAVATFPTMGEHSRALVRIGDDRVSDQQARNTLRMIMLDEESDAMHTAIHAVSNFRWGGTVVYNDRDIYYDVGIRLRSAPFGRRGRPGWNIRFGDEQPFRGVHSTAVIDGALNVPRGDGTGWVTTTKGASVNEMLFNVAANRAGGIGATYDDLVYFAGARRSDKHFAQLKMMRYENPYLDEMLPDVNGSDGNLYKQELIYYPTSTSNGRPDGFKNGFNMVTQIDIRTLGEDKDAYRFNYLLRNNTARDDFTSIIEMGKAFSSTGTLKSAEIENIVDVDNWMRTLAFNALFGVADTYNNGLAHNLVFYSRPDDGRVMILPWDLDHALYYAANASIFGQGTHRAKSLIDLSWNRRRFRGHLLDICNTAFTSDYLDPWIDHLHERADQNYSRRFQRWVGERRNFVLEQIENASPSLAFSIDADLPAQSAEALTTLTGSGWIDVHSLRLSRGTEPPQTLPASFRDGIHWNLTVPLVPGENNLVVEALNYRGEIVGSDSVTITQTGAAAAPGPGSLLIAEFMYHPDEPTTAEQQAGLVASDAFEFVELLNVGDHPLQLNGCRFGRGITFDFAAHVLQPGQRALIVSNATAYLTRYGAGARILGVYSGSLANSGETIELVDALGSVIDVVDYEDQLPWPPEADGEGYSLTRIEKGTTMTDQSHQSWRPSSLPGGSPGGSDAIALADFASPVDYLIAGPMEVLQNDGELLLRWSLRTAADEVRAAFEVSSDLVTWLPIEFTAKFAESLGDGTRTFEADLPSEQRPGYVRMKAVAVE